MFHARFGALLSILSLSLTVHAQSLGDVARQQKQKKSQQPNSTTASAPKKVYTDEDIKKSGAADDDVKPAVDSPLRHSVNRPTHQETNQPTLSAEQWKAKIQQQKDLISALEKRIEKLQASVNYVQNNRNVYINAPEHNDRQHRKELTVQQLKGQLEAQKTELKELQEQARQEGFGNAVYQ